MIVATAGHIDHGKTALVKALTGVDTDRLPEEKRRGLSIDLGFAYRYGPDDQVLAFVDVPGHERFIRNMLAGVTSVDFALLAVAADDGPMPQTVEHLAILDLLGLASGAVALTKIDRVSSTRVEEATAAVQALIEGSGLTGVPIFPVSTVTGEGVAALTAHLWEMARTRPERTARGNFRLAVDRCFTLAGTGLVVTGTVFSGRVRVGDRLVVTPAGTPVRVRSLHAHNRPSDTASAGDRCAFNLAGGNLRKASIRRGDWIVDGAAHAPVERFDARLRVLASEAGPLRHWTSVHIHIGATDVGGRVAVLDRKEIHPGTSALVQIVLDRPIGATFGDRFVLRDISAQRTIAGGAVIDPYPPRYGRAQPARLAALAALAAPDPAAALAALLAQSPEGVELEPFARARNLTPADRAALGTQASFLEASVGGRQRAIDAARWRTYGDAVFSALAEAHDASPESRGLAIETLRERTRTVVPGRLLDAVVAGLMVEGKAARTGAFLHRAGHSPTASDPDAALWDKVLPLLTVEGAPPPPVQDIAATVGLPPAAMARFLRRMASKGRVIAVADGRYYAPNALIRLCQIVETLAATAPDGAVTAAAFRDQSGIGRNRAIEMLEFFDRVGFTRRDGDIRRIVRRAHDVLRSLGAGGDAR